MPELEERLAVKCLVRRFKLEETMGYIQHRLSAAGAKEPIFTDGALEAIHQETHGVPRRINRLCDLALCLDSGIACTVGDLPAPLFDPAKRSADSPEQSA